MTRDVEELQRDGSPLDDATLRRVLTNFQALDKDGDGHLTPGEFREGLGMLGVDEGFCRLVFDTFDIACNLNRARQNITRDRCFKGYACSRQLEITYCKGRFVPICIFSYGINEYHFIIGCNP